MTTTNDGGPADVHPMVMKAAKSWFAFEIGATAEEDPDAWELYGHEFLTQAQAALTECGALECLEALEKLARLGNGEHYGNSDGNMIAREAITKVYGSAPE
jgi:hypothetical protein